MSEVTSTPTQSQFTNYQAAYDYFNRELFKGELKPCLLVLKDPGRKKGGIVMGHFGPHRWGNVADPEQTTHEISLNPITLNQPYIETFQTLVHEMCHQWQQDHDKPPRCGYHDRRWGKKMEEVGLMPSNTGKPDGKKTGQQMSDYVIEDGAFARAVEAMPAEIRLPWHGIERLALSKPKRKSKVKYVCECGCKVWGKPELDLTCNQCSSAFEAEGEV